MQSGLRGMRGRGSMEVGGAMLSWKWTQIGLVVVPENRELELNRG